MKNKKNLLAIAGLVGVLALGGSFAYFSNIASVENPFKTAKYETTVVETFTPDNEWEPGTTTNKEVLVTNTGNAPIVARVKYQDAWQLQGETEFKDVTDVDSQTIKNLTLNESPTAWVDGEDGYYYYTSVINEEGSSNKFLDSVTLKPETFMGSYIDTTYYKLNVDDKDWIEVTEDHKLPETYAAKKVESTLDPENPGYAEAQYKLTITVETTQADRGATAGWVTNETSGTVIEFLNTLPGNLVEE